MNLNIFSCCSTRQDAIGQLIGSLKRLLQMVEQQEGALKEREKNLRRSPQLLGAIIERILVMVFVAWASDPHFCFFNHPGEIHPGFPRERFGKSDGSQDAFRF